MRRATIGIIEHSQVFLQFVQLQRMNHGDRVFSPIVQPLPDRPDQIVELDRDRYPSPESRRGTAGSWNADFQPAQVFRLENRTAGIGQPSETPFPVAQKNQAHVVQIRHDPVAELAIEHPVRVGIVVKNEGQGDAGEFARV